MEGIGLMRSAGTNSSLVLMDYMMGRGQEQIDNKKLHVI